MMRTLLVGVAGALGALARYGLGLAVGPVTFPWVTLVINVSGAFVLGVVLTVAPARHWSPNISTPIAVGFLGAYTTFSTFSWETFVVGRVDGRWAAAAVYVVASVVLGIAAAWAGHNVARSVAAG